MRSSPKAAGPTQACGCRGRTVVAGVRHTPARGRRGHAEAWVAGAFGLATPKSVASLGVNVCPCRVTRPRSPGPWKMLVCVWGALFPVFTHFVGYRPHRGAAHGLRSHGVRSGHVSFALHKVCAAPLTPSGRRAAGDSEYECRHPETQRGQLPTRSGSGPEPSGPPGVRRTVGTCAPRGGVQLSSWPSFLR